MNTKRILALVLSLCMIFSLAISGVAFADDDVAGPNAVENNQDETTQNTQDQGTTYYTVTFDYGDRIEQVKVEKVADPAWVTSGILYAPKNPKRESANGIRYEFVKWMDGNTDMFDGKESVEISGDLVLVARWDEYLCEGYEVFAKYSDGSFKCLTGNDTIQTLAAGATEYYVRAIQQVTATTRNATPVARVGSVAGQNEYTTLEAALAAATSGQTVTLLADIDYSEVTKNRNAHDRGEELRVSLNDVTLDLNGKSITTVNASVVFDGVGTIQNGTFKLNHINATGAEQNGSYALCIDKPTSGSTNLVLNNLVLEGGLNVWSSTVTLNNVTAATTASKYYAVWAEQEGTIVTINSGTFTDNQSGGKGVLATGNSGDEAGAKIYVKGGTFNGVNKLVYGCEENSISITGGTFNTDPSDYVADGYVATKSNDVWTVSGAVAQIGTTKYASLADAINAAQENDTVTLLADVTLGAWDTTDNKNVGINITKSITLDGANHKISGTDAVTRGIWINDSGLTVTIKNLTIEGNNLERAIQVNNYKNNVTLNIENVTATSTHYTVNICSDVDNLRLNITGSNLTGWAAINSYASNSTLTVSDSTLVGINNYSSPTNDFSTIVFDGGSLVDVPGAVSSTLTITDSTIIAKEKGTNKQSWISFQYGATGNSAAVVSITGTSILDDVNGNDKTSALYISAKNNVITMALTEDQKSDIEAAGYTVTTNAQDPTKYDISLVPEVYYYWNDANGQFKDGTDSSFNAPYENGWLVEGEFIRLEKDVALTKNLSNDFSYSLFLNNKSINAGEYTIEIAAGKTVTSDTAGLNIFSAPEGYAILTGGDAENGFTYTAVEAVAQISDVKYATLAAAVAAVPTNGTETTITLLQNASGEAIAVNGNRNIVLDLNGKTLTPNSMYVYGGTLTANNGTIAGTVNVYGFAQDGVNSSAFTLGNNATIDSHYSVVLRESSNTKAAYDAVVTINGTTTGNIWVMGNIEAGDSVVNVNGNVNSTLSDVGVALNGFATVNIAPGASVSAQKAGTGKGTAVEVRAGTLNVTGGTIIGYGAPSSVTANGSGTTSDGAGIAVSTYDLSDISVNISGGNISGYSPLYLANTKGTTSHALALSVTAGTFTCTEGGANAVAVNEANPESRAVKFISGGTFSSEPNTNFIAEGYAAVKNENVWVITTHTHSYGAPSWSWRRINGAWAAVATFTCTKGDDTQYVRAEITEETSQGKANTFATVIFNGEEYKDSKTEVQSFNVTMDGKTVNSYEWGALCSLTYEDGTTARKWYINNKLVADGRGVYNFAVTEDSAVTTEETQVVDPIAVVSATLTSTKTAKAVFNAKWSLPTKATVNSVIIYRGYNTAAKDYSVAIMKQYGTAYNANLPVRNGDFTLNLSNLTSGSYQYAVIVINYTPEGGNPTELVSPVLQVQVAS